MGRIVLELMGSLMGAEGRFLHALAGAGMGAAVGIILNLAVEDSPGFVFLPMVAVRVRRSGGLVAGLVGSF